MQYTDESRHCPWCGRWVTPDILAADHLGAACRPSSREAWRQAREAHRRRVRRIQAEAARRDGTPATIRRAGIPPWEDPGHIQAFASMLAERNLPDDGPEPWRPPAPEPHRDDLKTRILAHVNGGWMSGASIAHTARLPRNGKTYALLDELAVAGDLEARGVRGARGPSGRRYRLAA